MRIPQVFGLSGGEVVMCEEGQRLSSVPAPESSLLAWLATIEPSEEDLPEVEDAPPEPVEL